MKLTRGYVRKNVIVNEKISEDYKIKTNLDVPFQFDKVDLIIEKKDESFMVTCSRKIYENSLGEKYFVIDGYRFYFTKKYHPFNINIYYIKDENNKK